MVLRAAAGLNSNSAKCRETAAMKARARLLLWQVVAHYTTGIQWQMDDGGGRDSAAIHGEDAMNFVEDRCLVECAVLDRQNELRSGTLKVGALHAHITIGSSIADRSDDGMERYTRADRQLGKCLHRWILGRQCIDTCVA